MSFGLANVKIILESYFHGRYSCVMSLVILRYVRTTKHGRLLISESC